MRHLSAQVPMRSRRSFRTGRSWQVQGASRRRRRVPSKAPANAGPVSRQVRRRRPTPRTHLHCFTQAQVCAVAADGLQSCDLRPGDLTVRWAAGSTGRRHYSVRHPCASCACATDAAPQSRRPLGRSLASTGHLMDCLMNTAAHSATIRSWPTRGNRKPPAQEHIPARINTNRHGSKRAHNTFVA